jgi:hypothetical protein
MKMDNLSVRFKYFSQLTVLVFLFVLVTGSVLAAGKPSDAGAQAATGQAQTNLTEAKLRVCKARENAIKTRSSHLTQLTTTMETKFDAIAARVENYYTSKVIPSGKTVANYDALVADIQTKKAAVATALSAAQTDANNFSCAEVSPKEQLAKFRVDMQTVKSALKNYRTSIKNLIVAVHSVTGTDNKEVKPSVSPGGSE